MKVINSVANIRYQKTFSVVGLWYKELTTSFHGFMSFGRLLHNIDIREMHIYKSSQLNQNKFAYSYMWIRMQLRINREGVFRELHHFFVEHFANFVHVYKYKSKELHNDTYKDIYTL